MVPICPKFCFLLLKIRIPFLNKKEFLGIGCFEILSNQDGSNPIKKGDFLYLVFRKGIRIHDTSTIKKGGEHFHLFCIPFWRHGRAVRRGTANPFSPVQIRVSPDQQKTRNPPFCYADIIRRIIHH